jgi:hypothetical protein
MSIINKDFRVKHGLAVEANTHLNGNLQVDGTINGLNVNSLSVQTQATFDQANSASLYANTGITLSQNAYDYANTLSSGLIDDFTLWHFPIGDYEYVTESIYGGLGNELVGVTYDLRIEPANVNGLVQLDCGNII